MTTEKTETTRWHNKPFVSFLTLTGFITMSLTGVILFFTPQGKLAFWVNWTFWGMTKEEWGNVHITTSLFFLLAGAYHTYYNWKALTGYIVNKISGALKLKKEIAVATIITLFIVLGGLYRVPPFHWVLEWNNFLKHEFWVTSKEVKPPFSHAEELSLKKFTEKQQIDLAQASAELREKGFEFKESDSLDKIARKNNSSPMQLYNMIKKFEPESNQEEEESGPSHEELESLFGRGLGRVTLQELCDKLDLNLNRTIHLMEYRGLQLNSDNTLHEIADDLGTNPMGAVQIILQAHKEHSH